MCLRGSKGSLQRMMGSVRGTHLIISIKDKANLLVGLLAGFCQLDGFKQNAKKRPINSDEDLDEEAIP